MPNPNVIVARVMARPGAPSFEDARAVAEPVFQLADENVVRLDPADERAPGHAAVLDGLAKLGRPAYIEIDPDTGALARLFIPAVSAVHDIQRDEAGGDLRVTLRASQQMLTLRRDSPYFNEFESVLRQRFGKRELIVSSDDEQTILDVRPFRPGVDGDPDIVLRRDALLVRLLRKIWAIPVWIWRWKCWPWRWFGCISATRAQQIFDTLSATTCDPLTTPSPCIPFLYPDDGCWGRAHEMVRLMRDMGLRPRKVWIRNSPGNSLTVQTANNPNCHVNWGWHVAPTLCVRAGFWFLGRDMVIDPSLFATPVTKQDWKAIQNDPGATLDDTSGSVFHWWGNSTDPDYSQTATVLATYRLALFNRANQLGPPPYSCP